MSSKKITIHQWTGAKKVNTLYIVSASVIYFIAEALFTLVFLFPLPYAVDRGRILATASSRSSYTSSLNPLPTAHEHQTISEACPWNEGVYTWRQIFINYYTLQDLNSDIIYSKAMHLNVSVYWTYLLCQNSMCEWMFCLTLKDKLLNKSWAPSEYLKLYLNPGDDNAARRVKRGTGLTVPAVVWEWK